MKQEVKIFGAALDPLSSPERLNLKLSYLDYLRVQPKENVHADPYDILKEYLRKELPWRCLVWEDENRLLVNSKTPIRRFTSFKLGNFLRFPIQRWMLGLCNEN